VGLSTTPESTPVSAATHQNNIFQTAHDYVAGVMQAMVAGGVKPDMVQIGNETNSGMSGIDMTDWPAFSAIVNAGITAVRETDPRIIVWAQNGRPRDANFGTWVDEYLSDKAPYVPSIDEDGICGSTYGSTTTPPGDDWKQWFGYVITTYDKPVMSCEYTDKSPDSPAGAVINGVMHGFANHMGYGSFIWEPTRYPNLNSSTLFTCGAGTAESCATPWKFVANALMAQYPVLAKSYGLPVPSATCQP
jgi:arabinogalactan endo-1,4-beta-galactosidase